MPCLLVLYSRKYIKEWVCDCYRLFSNWHYSLYYWIIFEMGQKIEKRGEMRRKTVLFGEKIDAVLMVIVSIVQIIVAIQRRDTLSIVLAILLTISCMVSVVRSYKKGKEREERYRREFDEKYRKGENYLDRD